MQGLMKLKQPILNITRRPFYAFKFVTDSVKGIVDYFNEDAKNLRRAFLKAPVQFSTNFITI